MVIDPKSGSNWIVTSVQTHCSKKFSRHLLAKVPETTLVSFEKKKKNPQERFQSVVDHLDVVYFASQARQWILPPSIFSPPPLEEGQGSRGLLSSLLTKNLQTASRLQPPTSEGQVRNPTSQKIYFWDRLSKSISKVVWTCGIDATFLWRLISTHQNHVLRGGAGCSPGVTVLAVGVEQADTEELRRAVTQGRTQNVLYVRDASQLDAIHTDLADLLCGIARISTVGIAHHSL